MMLTRVLFMGVRDEVNIRSVDDQILTINSLIIKFPNILWKWAQRLFQAILLPINLSTYSCVEHVFHTAMICSPFK